MYHTVSRIRELRYDRGLDWRLTATALSPRRLFLVAIETGFFFPPLSLIVMDMITEIKLYFSPWSLLEGRVYPRGYHLPETP